MVNQNELELLRYKTGGHLDGGIYLDKTSGKSFFLKIPNTHNEVQNEMLASKLYQLLGIKTPSLDLIEFNGGMAIISEGVENYVNLGDAAIPEAASGLYENFVIDAWLANWDVVGLEFDNIGFAGNEAVRIDLGGSLLYRGMGALKGKMFTTHVSEVCSMLNFSINYNSALIFRDTSIKHFLDGVTRIARFSNTEIESLVFEYAPGDDNEKRELTEKLIARKDDLIKKADMLSGMNQDGLISNDLCGLASDIQEL